MEEGRLLKTLIGVASCPSWLLGPRGGVGKVRCDDSITWPAPLHTKGPGSSSMLDQSIRKIRHREKVVDYIVQRKLMFTFPDGCKIKKRSPE
jgi:hypothetical protein